MTQTAIRSYDDLQAVLRAVAEQRQLSREAIDELAGLQPGYASKVLAELPARKLGPDTLGPMLGALGLKLIAVDDEEALAKYTERMDKRVEWRAKNACTHSAAVVVKLSPRKLSKIGRKGGKRSRANISERKATSLAKKAGRNSRRYMTKKEARELAVKAAQARWHKPNLVEVTTPKAQ